MQIEAIHTKSSSPSKGTVVLLHGVCFGAWYWENNFQPWFTEHGYDVIAISYRNHSKSESKGSLRWRTINEYIEDIHSVVAAITGDVYLIGHSMGGFLLQHYLQKHPSSKIKKAVLLCTVPANGIGGATWQVIKTYPFSFLHALVTFSFKPVFNTKAKRLMFANHFPDDELQPIVARMQDESFRAYLDMMILNLPSTKPPGFSKAITNSEPLTKTPEVSVLMIGGEDDFLVRPSALKKNAKQLNAELVLMKGAHCINMEEGWERVAERIEQFFTLSSDALV
jgi:pimeloyl-ACP methyl ester carboxylesterase